MQNVPFATTAELRGKPIFGLNGMLHSTAIIFLPLVHAIHM